MSTFQSWIFCRFKGCLPTNPFNPTSGLTRSPNNCAVHVTNGDVIAAFNSHSPLTTRRKQKGWHERSNLKDTIAGHMEFPRVGIEQLCGNNIHCREVKCLTMADTMRLGQDTTPIICMERQTLRGKVTHDNKLKGKLSNLAYDMREKKNRWFWKNGYNPNNGREGKRTMRKP